MHTVWNISDISFHVLVISNFDKCLEAVADLVVLDIFFTGIGY